MKPLLIGLSGKAEHGKNVAARIITEWVEQNGGTAATFEISQLIMDECIELGYLPVGTTRNQNDKLQNKILVDHGSARRNESQAYWTDKIVEKMEALGPQVSICPNIRFPTEGERIQQKGGFIIRVNRLNPDGSGFISETRDPNHITETALDRWSPDFQIYNHTGHGELFQDQLWALFEYIVDHPKGE